MPEPFEPSVTDLVRNIGGECFIDVGANVGIYAIRYSKNFRQVFAVEPHPRTRQTLRMKIRVRHARNVRVLEFAASDKEGWADMVLHGTIGRSSGSEGMIEPDFTYRPSSSPDIIGDVKQQNSTLTKIRVRTSALDSYPFPNDIELVKIDVEGAEFRVLDGAVKTLAKTRRVIVELHDRDRRTELQNVLHYRWGFKTRWLDADHILGARVA